MLLKRFSKQNQEDTTSHNKDIKAPGPIAMALASLFCPAHREKLIGKFFGREKTPEERLDLLRAFIGNEDFVCVPGSAFEKKGKIQYVVLDEEQAFYHQLKDAAESIIGGRDRAWVIQFPKEPKNYVELEQIKQEVCAHFFLALTLHGQDPLDLMEQAARLSPAVAYPQIPIDEKVHMSQKEMLATLKAYLASQLTRPSFDFESVAINHLIKAYEAKPNLVPVVGNRGTLDLNVLSPIFHQSTVPTCPLLKETDLPHVSFAPSTCMAVLFDEDIRKARSTEAGVEAQRRLLMRASLYNGHTVREGFFTPGLILSNPFLLPPNAEAKPEVFEAVEGMADLQKFNVRAPDDNEAQPLVVLGTDQKVRIDYLPIDKARKAMDAIAKKRKQSQKA